MPKVIWESQGGKVVLREFEDIRRAQERGDKEFQTGSENRKRIAKAVREATRLNVTETEKLSQRLGDLNQAYKQGDLNAKLYERELERLRKQFAAPVNNAFRKAMDDMVAPESVTRAKQNADLRASIEKRLSQEVAQERVQSARVTRRALDTIMAPESPARRRQNAELQASIEKRLAKEVAQDRIKAAQSVRNAVGPLTDAESPTRLRQNADLRASIEKRLNREVAQERKQTAIAAEREVQAAREQNARQAARVVDQNRGPRERLKRDLREVIRLRRAEALSTDDARRAVARLKDAYRDSQAAARSSFSGGALSQIRNYALGVGGIMTLISEARAELQAAQAEADARATTGTSTATALKELRLNLAALPEADEQAIIERARAAADKANVPRAKAFNDFREAISGSPSAERGARFAEFGLNLLRDLPGSSEVTGGLIDIGNALNVGPEQSAGVAFGAAQRARTTDIRKFTTNAAQSLQTAISRDLDPAKSLALFNALTVAGADPEGERSRTGISRFTEELGQFFTDERVRRLGLDPNATAQQRFDLLAGDANLGRQFIEASGFGSRQFAGLAGFFQQTSPEARNAFDLTLADLQRPGSELAARGQALSERINRPTGAERTAEANRIVSSKVEEARLLTPGLAEDSNRLAVVAQIARFRRDNNTFGNNIASTVLGTETAVGTELFLEAGSDVTDSELATFLQGELTSAANLAPQSRATPEYRILFEMLQELRGIRGRAEAPAAAFEQPREE